MATTKGYKGLAMEGVIATWYARNTGQNRSRFADEARAVAARVPPGGRVLEVASGPGYLAIELAQKGRRVTTLDISESFVRIARENAARSGVSIDVRHGNASAMPFGDASFDYIVCVAAFKNFTDPVGALNEMHRVLVPGGEVRIVDLDRNAASGDVEQEVRNMHLSAWNAWMTRWTFRTLLLKRAYTREDFERMAAASRFGACRVSRAGVGLEVRLEKPAVLFETTAQ